MNAGLSTEPGTVAPGQIQFFDSIQPPLEAGEYTLSAEQQILDIPGETVKPYISTQQVLIDGPRFSINPSQIHTLYPPANQQGLYDNVLPNIVFSNFSLPWARPIDPAASQQLKGIEATKDGAGNVIPWMGLLTLYPADLDTTGGTSKVSNPKTVTVSQLAAPEDPNILPPVLGNLFGAEDEKVTVVDLDLSFFQSISPKLSELPFLAHARTVNTGGKILLGMDDDGCFSLVIGNRLPQAGGRNSVFLVSYEGHQDHLRGSTIPGNYTKIRLCLLGAWQFTVNAAQGSFIKLMGDLCEKGRGGVTLFGMPESAATSALSATAKEALEIGYIPLQNNMRQGETATSWYRGPLMPAPTKRDFAYGPYHYSDHAIQYDPEYGLFNHAYSAAWQIGRLLALSDASFSIALFQWRNRYLRAIVANARKVGTDKLQVIAGNEADGMLAAVRSLFTASFRNVDWPQVKLRTSATPDPQLPGVLTEQEKEAMFENDEDPLLVLTKKIKGA